MHLTPKGFVIQDEKNLFKFSRIEMAFASALSVLNFSDKHVELGKAICK
jgi:hypothetical protein